MHEIPQWYRLPKFDIEPEFLLGTALVNPLCVWRSGEKWEAQDSWATFPESHPEGVVSCGQLELQVEFANHRIFFFSDLSFWNTPTPDETLYIYIYKLVYNVLLCHFMLFHVMFCFVMFCFVLFCSVLLCYVRTSVCGIRSLSHRVQNVNQVRRPNHRRSSVCWWGWCGQQTWPGGRVSEGLFGKGFKRPSIAGKWLDFDDFDLQLVDKQRWLKSQPLVNILKTKI